MNYPMTDLEARESLVGDIYLLKEIYGYSAYELAVKQGFKGSLDEWLLSLTAYGVAVRNGFEGTLEEWISSLRGEKGEPGTMELHGDLDALGERITNVADPVDDMDVVNKKYLEEQNSASKNYVDETFVKKDDQLDANNKAVVNVATPINDTDAVNKKYVHDFFQSISYEDISDDFIAEVYSICTVYSKKVYKQGNLIIGEIVITNPDLTEGTNICFRVNGKYKPLARIVSPVLAQTIASGNSTYYLNETLNAYFENAAGNVILGGYQDNAEFRNNFLISFTYLCA